MNNFKECVCGNILNEVLEGYRCSNCGEVYFWNPPTIGIAVVPIADWKPARIGALLVERADGGLAFPGGFQGRESITQTIIRELREETNVELPAEHWETFEFCTTPDLRQNLYFGLYTQLLDRDVLDRFQPNYEVVGVTVVTAPVRMKFPLHEKVLRKFFQQQTTFRIEREQELLLSAYA